MEQSVEVLLNIDEQRVVMASVKSAARVESPAKLRVETMGPFLVTNTRLYMESESKNRSVSEWPSQLPHNMDWLLC
jgi:hypothetical protein